ncbi:hypothetical protein CEN46_26395 [Fischerella thermalis CCMEE 5318]|uniref:Uncharacterized protein n=1 Tax=Fischerella thermalis CCMEE 5318 TaxID=2019666 RepID=A0A2N6L3R8_9CYAN|nr:hypothetical protein CEN46_26395 [Fischerella thermalis CCMEE 5318]
MDFRFWIGNCFTCLDSINRSVAFFFQTGIIFIKPQLIFRQKNLKLLLQKFVKTRLVEKFAIDTQPMWQKLMPL